MEWLGKAGIRIGSLLHSNNYKLETDRTKPSKLSCLMFCLDDVLCFDDDDDGDDHDDDDDDDERSLGSFSC